MKRTFSLTNEVTLKCTCTNYTKGLNDKKTKLSKTGQSHYITKCQWYFYYFCRLKTPIFLLFRRESLCNA